MPQSPGDVRSLRRSLEARGPLVARIGQELSIRADFLPEAAVKDLLLLNVDAPPASWTDISRVVAAELGQPPERLFERINTSPFSADALTQVHLAVTHLGERVAVRVQRPGAVAELDRQLAHLDQIHSLLDAIDGCQPPEIGVLRAELTNAMHASLDFERTARNLALFETMLPLSGLRLPLPYAEYSATLVLTTEYLEGVPLDELLASLAEGAAPFGELEIDGARLGDNLVRAALQQAFGGRPFPVALTPAGLVVLADDVVGVVDLGRVDEIDAADLQRLLSFVTAVYNADTTRTVAAAVDLLDGPLVGRDAFREDFVEEARRWRQQVALDEQDGAATLRHHLHAVIQLSSRHGLVLAPPVVDGARALLTAEAAAGLISPSSGLASVGRSFFVREQIKMLVREFSLGSLEGLGLDVVGLATESPGQVQRLVADLAEDRFVFRVSATESPADRAAANRRARLLAAAIIFVGMAILVVRGADAGVFATVVLGVLAASALTVVGVLWARLK